MRVSLFRSLFPGLCERVYRVGEMPLWHFENAKVYKMRDYELREVGEGFVDNVTALTMIP